MAHWGKANPHTFHLLQYHCLDVAAVAAVLTNTHSGTLPFFTALHDLGKFTEAFQNLRPDLLLRLQHKTSSLKYITRHDTAGFHLWKEIWPENPLHLDTSEFDIYDWNLLVEPTITAITGHHGTPPLNSSEPFSPSDISAARQFIAECYELFLASEYPAPTVDFDDAIAAAKLESWHIAGITVVADWIASNETFFPYIEYEMPLEAYWQIALRQAASAIKSIKLYPKQVSQDTGIKQLFPFINTPSPVQSYVETCEIAPGPQLFIIEELTGSGKTEAALTLAHRIMAAGQADSIYVALPTMATSNSMYERIAKMYTKMYTEEPSLILAHSASNQHSSWLTDNHKKYLLADVGVGTIDQALISILPLKHQSLRMFGLNRTVLIIDEVHAFDPYMHSLLCKLIEFHNGSVILLSATLTMQQRSSLVGTAVHRTEYPLVTHSVVGGAVTETALDIRDGTRRTVDLEFFDDTASVYQRICDEFAAGKTVCWIRNTVADARKAYLYLSTMYNDSELMLFHSKFTLSDRLKKEDVVRSVFGPDTTNRRPMILIATQVVEQSLDIDFDYIVSDLAPIDLLIQRIGRLHRHRVRGTPVFGILSPEITSDPDEFWYSRMFYGGAYVYPNHGQLWLTASALKSAGHITVPDDLRPLLEYVYDNSVIPNGLQRATQKALATTLAEKSVASINALNFAGGYRRSVNPWGSVSTRLGDETITVRLSLHGEPLGEIQVRKYQLCRGNREPPNDWTIIVELDDGYGYNENGEEVGVTYDSRIGLVLDRK